MWGIVVKWLGHWLVYFILSAVVLWGLYAGIIRPVTKPNPSTKQEAKIINNYTYNIKPTFGCMRMPIQNDKK